MTRTQQGATGGEQHALTRTDKHRYTTVPDSHTLAHMLTIGIQEGRDKCTHENNSHAALFLMSVISAQVNMLYMQ